MTNPSFRIVRPLALAGLLLGGSACGPFPGYERHYDPPPEEQDGPHEEAPSTSGGRRGAYRGIEPAPAAEGQPSAAKASQQGIRIIQTGEKGVYYLVDIERRLCFFHASGAVTAMDCSQLPEAAELIGDLPPAEDGAAPPEEAAAPPPTEESVDLPEPDPDVPGGTATPAELGKAPTADEKRRFTLAYVRIFCDQREGRATAPSEAIAAEGLTPARYAQIEGWMASDAKVWRALRAAAIASCGGATPTPEK